MLRHDVVPEYLSRRETRFLAKQWFLEMSDPRGFGAVAGERSIRDWI